MYVRSLLFRSHGRRRDQLEPSQGGAHHQVLSRGRPLSLFSDHERYEGGAGSPDEGDYRSNRRRAHHSGALHADTVRRSRIVPVRAVHQYSSQLPSRFQGSKTISPGTFARREDDRGDRPLCDGGSDRKSTRLNPVTNAHLVCRLLLEKKKNKSKQKHEKNMMILN